MFEALHEHVTHRIELPMPIEACFPLFTAQGETLWVPDWHPVYVYPADGHTTQGMVFITGQCDETTYWTMVDYDPLHHFSRYARVTPGSRSVMVEVRCEAVAENTTAVQVSYTLTGLSEAGNQSIRTFVGDAYVAMIEEWRTLILAWLARSAG
ncbi:SRPBCC family protein [Leeia oryzae]|uniref:SRPBCC family protein n=1 Tax=Leeia oryzae TaxID=356662 RepID=UPI0003674BB2|nr:SRPBCC family protein [Leeia oryzae]